MKNRGGLRRILARLDRCLKSCSGSIENDSSWALKSADTQELAQIARKIAPFQLSMMKLSRELLSVSHKIRALMVGTSHRLYMPAKRKVLSRGKNETSRQRFAFATVKTENGALVVRVRENTSEVWPQKEYGHFETWTQAQGFATVLNQRHGLDVIEALHIVVSAGLAAAKPRGQKA